MAIKKSTSKAVVTWDEELAKQADIAAQQEANAGGGQFFSLRSGVLTWQDAPLPNNEMAVVILDHVFENVYYEQSYDPDSPASPTCFAFGRDEKDLAPHVIVTDAGQAQSLEGCSKCEHNEWGSAERGKGKACRNTRRLALIPAGQLDRHGEFTLHEDPEHYESASIGFMKLPVTSVKGYANFVKQVALGLRRPPAGVITKVRVVPDAKSQFKVLFEPVMKAPDAIMGAIMARVEEVKPQIDFPYQLADVEEAVTSRATTKAKKPAAKQSRKY